MKLERERAEHYIKDLFLTFDVSNPALANQWAEFLMWYSEDTIKAAWRNIVMECKPRYLPELKKIAKILDDSKVKVDEYESVPELSRKDKSQFSQVMELCQEGMTKIRQGIWTQSEYYEKSALLYESFGMHSAADYVRGKK